MKLDRALSINGWMSGPELTFLAQTASMSKKILEVGSYKGRSTRALADNTNGIVYAVDPWDGKYQVKIPNYHDEAYISYLDSVPHYNGDNLVYSEFCINLADHLSSNKVKAIRKNFNEFRDRLNFDFIFIDAIHEYENVKEDINHALTMIEKDGIIAGHDYRPEWPGVIKAVDEIFPKIEKVDTIWFIQI